MKMSTKIMMVVALCLSLFFLPACATSGVSPLAIGTLDEPHVGCYVGGGKQHGQDRRVHEGTWGREYVGWDLLHINDLRWGHEKKRTQGGMGSY